LYAMSDIVAVPSWVEGFGRVAVEAMLARKPVVGSAVGGIPEIVVDGDTGIIARPKDPKDLAARLAYLLDDGGLRRRMGEAGAERAHRLYRPEKHVDRVVRVYEEILGQ